MDEGGNGPETAARHDRDGDEDGRIVLLVEQDVGALLADPVAPGLDRNAPPVEPGVQQPLLVEPGERGPDRLDHVPQVAVSFDVPEANGESFGADPFEGDGGHAVVRADVDAPLVE